MRIPTRHIAEAGIIGALYAALTVAFAPISYGPVQVRIAEALTVLPFLTGRAIWGLYAGCLVANIFGGYGLVDIFGGSFLTLLAAIATWWLRRFNRPLLAPLPPVLINALGVSLYLHILAKWPYWLTVAYVGLGEFAACYILGYPLLLILRRRITCPIIFRFPF